MFIKSHPRIIAAFVAASAVLAPMAAFAAIDLGPYVGVALGAGLQNTQNVTDDTKTSNTASGNRFGTGFVGRVEAGYSIENTLRPEVELGFQRKSGKNGGIDENGYSAMANLWVDVIHQSGYFVDFGGGVGLIDVDLSRGSDGDNAISPAWQLGAGAGVDLTPNLALAADFRRLTSFDKSSFDVTSTEQLHTRFASNAVLLELRYSFAGAASGGSILDHLLQ